MSDNFYSVLTENENKTVNRKKRTQNTPNNDNTNKGKSWSKKSEDNNTNQKNLTKTSNNEGWKSKSFDNSNTKKNADWKNKSFGRKMDKPKKSGGISYTKIDLLQLHSPSHSLSFNTCSLPVFSEEPIAPYSYSPKNKSEIGNLIRSMNRSTNWKSSTGSQPWNKYSSNDKKWEKDKSVKQEKEEVKEIVEEKVKDIKEKEVVVEEPVKEEIKEIPEPVEPEPEIEEEPRLPHELIEEDVQSVPKLHLENFWYYKAPDQELHGPYNAVKMEKWMKKGFFNVSLEVKYRNSLFQTLGEVFIELNRNPFTQEPLSVWLQKPENCNLKKALPDYIIKLKGIQYLNETLGFRSPVPLHVPQRKPEQPRSIDPAQMFSMPPPPQSFTSTWFTEQKKLQEMQMIMIKQHNMLMEKYGIPNMLGNPDMHQNKRPGQYPEQGGRTPEEQDIRRQTASVWNDY
eukprot:TRINITY_DN3688_c0_g2_i1.p1 TRINITY_DN3688_c0_g2~~TRINITY_DN3688_c0_g2_i1.p1  ORF type:complete len:454 (-),score=126.50 TRINITY_DN3688_c0_g2_i1:15-1376(-)